MAGVLDGIKFELDMRQNLAAKQMESLREEVNIALASNERRALDASRVRRGAQHARAAPFFKAAPRSMRTRRPVRAARARPDVRRAWARRTSGRPFSLFFAIASTPSGGNTAGRALAVRWPWRGEGAGAGAGAVQGGEGERAWKRAVRTDRRARRGEALAGRGVGSCLARARGRGRVRYHLPSQKKKKKKHADAALHFAVRPAFPLARPSRARARACG